MAQKREKEETELKVPESLSICSPPTPPVTVPTPPSQLSANTTDDQRINYARSDLNLSGGIDDSRSSSIFVPRSSERTDLVVAVIEEKSKTNRSLKRPRDANRCSGLDCRRKLGLMGFRCRCGDMFCSEHRYSDRHGCSYDYKAAGREAIARENPVVKAAKIIKV